MLHPSALQFVDLGKAMNFLEEKRKEASLDNDISAITMCAEDINQVGKMGVASIENGLTPDGEEYTWSKAHRAGATRSSYQSIIDNKSNG